MGGAAATLDATRLMITADAGGSNGYRVRMWKTELAKLAAETGLEITVCHYPPAPRRGTKSNGCGSLGGSYAATGMTFPV